MNSSLQMGPVRRAVHILLKAGILLWTYFAMKTILDGPAGGWLYFVPGLLFILVLWLNWKQSLWGGFILIGFGVLTGLFLYSGSHHTLEDMIEKAIFYVPQVLLGILLLIGVLIDRSRRK
jgi:hypothetical protein